MRIIAGTKRGAKLFTPEDSAIRPTSDRMRESMFNILMHAPWAPEFILREQKTHIVLDLFCGTGALGFEALSRGFDQAMFVDNAKTSLTLARKNAKHLGFETRCLFLESDAARPFAVPQPAQLVFLDPPYHQGLITPVLQNCLASNTLQKGAVLVAECAKNEEWSLPTGLTICEKRSYGKSTVTFMLYQ